MVDTSTVLIVDRDRDIAEGLAVRLRDAGYRAIPAADLAQGLNACGRSGPRAILVGVALPSLDGDATLVGCLEHAQPRRIPVISYSNSRSWQRRARSVGVVASLDEPFEVDRMFAALDLALRRPMPPGAAPALDRTTDRAAEPRESESRGPEADANCIAAPSATADLAAADCAAVDRLADHFSAAASAADGPANSAVRPPSSVRGDWPARLRQRILLVDDDVDIRTGAKLRLESAGYEVLCACDGRDALRLAVASHPDLILLDVRMPGMDGLTVLGRLRSLAETSDIPVVMLSASVFDQQSALDGGARFFMKKPYFAARLLAAVNAAIADGPGANRFQGSMP